MYCNSCNTDDKDEAYFLMSELSDENNKTYFCSKCEAKYTLAIANTTVGQCNKLDVTTKDSFYDTSLDVPYKNPGMFDPAEPDVGVKVMVLLLSVAIGFIIVMLLCSSCAKQDDPVDNLDVQMMSIRDEIKLRELRTDSTIRLDSARLRRFTTYYTFDLFDSATITLHNDTIGLGTLGQCVMRKVPPDSVMIIRRDTLVWVFWCKDWFSLKKGDTL